MKEFLKAIKELRSKVQIGTDKKSVCDLVQLIDSKSNKLLNFMEYKRENTQSEAIVCDSEKENIQAESIDANPQDYLLYIVNFVTKNIYDRVYFELGMRCLDIRMEPDIKFQIQLLAYGCNKSPDRSPEEIEEERTRIANNLEKYGFTIDQNNKFSFVENRIPFENYFKAMGAKTVDFSVCNDNIMAINVVVLFSDFNKWIVPVPEKESKSLVFNKSEVFHFQRLLDKLDSVLMEMPAFEDIKTALDSICVYNAEIQEIAGVNFDLRKSIELEQKKIEAEKNKISMIGDYAFQHYKGQVDFYNYDVENWMYSCMEMIGFCFADLVFYADGKMSFKLFYPDDEEQVEYTKTFRENTEKAIRKFLPSATIQSVCVNGNETFRTFEVVTDRFQDIGVLHHYAESLETE